MAHRTSSRVLLLVAAFVLLLVPVAAIAAGGFTDVDDDSVFKADIQWLADAGVTKGCNPPTNDEFCPDDYVTREQMSAFMHRLAVNQVVDAATAVEADHAATADSADQAANAQRLRGTPPSSFMNRVTSVHMKDIGVPDRIPGLFPADFRLEIEFDPPRNGMVVVTAVIGFQNDSVYDAVECQLVANAPDRPDDPYDGSPLPPSPRETLAKMNVELNGDTRDPSYEQCVVTAVYERDINHFVKVDVQGIDPTTRLGDATLTAVWYPIP